MIKNLMNTINDATPRSSALNDPSDAESPTTSFGAIWHGDFYHNVKGKKFGSEKKPLHFGMINDFKKKDIRKPTCSFAMLTTRRHGGRFIMKLPAGVIKTKVLKTSYMDLKYKIVVRKRALKNAFEFIQFLTPEYINEAKRIMKDGK
jgi:hypothetical protein